MNNISRLNLISDDPKFIVKPHDVSGERGQDINMTCLVDGNPPPSYTWFKNGNMNYVSSNVYIFCLYKLTFMQGCRNRGGRAPSTAPPPLIFGRSVNPIPTRGNRFCPLHCLLLASPMFFNFWHHFT